MFNDAEIERATAQLNEYRNNSTLSSILDQYSSLIDDYKRLKSDYEEERDAREKYKQMARGQERNPFVLVLVDGDGYIFDDDLINRGSDGGGRAAQQLHNAIKTSLRKKSLEHCQVMVRIYANIAGLSKTLFKAGLSGAEKRSVAPFVANFNRSYGLADFIDAGELKENADFKLRALLRLYADNAQCKHIYFAACHDVGYVSELMPHRGDSNRFTLINSPGVRFHDEFTKLGMGIEQLPGVFRALSLDVPTQPSSSSAPASRLNSTPVLAKASVATANKPTVASSPAKQQQQQQAPTGPAAGNDSREKGICHFYSMGKCRYGKSCKNLHLDDGPKGSGSSPVTKSTPTFGMNNHRMGKGGNDYTSNAGSDSDRHHHHNGGGGSGGGSGGGAGSARSNNAASSAGSPPDVPSDFSELPKKEDVPVGFVPVNDKEYRLDIYIPPPTAEAIAGLKARIGKRRLCNNMHLNGYCENSRCDYDHNPLEETFKSALESLARSIPCPKRGNCRSETCTWGHVCQRPDCKFRGGKVVCKMSYLSHTEELAVARYLPAVVRAARGNNRDGSVPNSPTSSPISDDDVQIITSDTLGGEEEEEEEDEDNTSHVETNGARIDSDALTELA